MMKTKVTVEKRSLALLLVLLMCLSLFPVLAYAEVVDADDPQNLPLEEQAQMDSLDEGFEEDSASVASSNEPGTENTDSDFEAENPNHDHSYVSVVTNPTCTKQGFTTYTCACGDSYVDDYTDALNHPEIINIPEVSATATEPGTTAGKKCALCGEILEGCEEVPPSEVPVINSENQAESDSPAVEEEDEFVIEEVVEEESLSEDSMRATLARGSDTIAIDEGNFPDPVFRAYIAANYDAVGEPDGYLSNNEIATVTSINVSGKGITSLKGVEYFDKLKELICYDNQLTELDVSRNIELVQLNCDFNALTELDVHRNTKLVTLRLADNKISNLDLSYNPNLQTLSTGVELQSEDGSWHTYGNPLSGLDVSGNRALKNLECPGSNLSVLDVSENTELESLRCWGNSLTSLDLSKNTKLLHLACSANPITALDVSKNTNLVNLVFQYCDVEALDLSHNPNLQQIRGAYNHLTSLNVVNHAALQRLECPHNELTSVDVSGCNALARFNCCYNQISSLNTTGCDALEFVDLGSNLLTSVSFAGLSKLLFLCVAENSIENLSLCNCPALVQLKASQANLKTLDLTGCSSLQYLSCWNNHLTGIDLSGNTALLQVNLSANKTLHSVTLGSQQSLEQLWVQNTSLSQIDIQGAPHIIEAYRDGTKIEFYGDGTVANLTGSGKFYGYKIGSGLNPESTWEIDHCSFCFDKNATIITYIKQNQWVKINGEWYYYDESGQILKNGWAKDSGGWCWLGSDGKQVENKWIKSDGARFR